MDTKISGEKLSFLLTTKLNECLGSFGLKVGRIQKTENVRNPKKAEIVIMLESLLGVNSNDHFSMNGDDTLYVSPNSNLKLLADLIGSYVVYSPKSYKGEELMYGSIYQVGTRTTKTESGYQKIVYNCTRNKVVTDVDIISKVCKKQKLRLLNKRDLCSGRQAIGFNPAIHKFAIHGSISNYDREKGTVTLQYYGDDPVKNDIKLYTFNECDVFGLVAEKETASLVEKVQIIDTQEETKMTNLPKSVYFGNTEDKKWIAQSLVLGNFDKKEMTYQPYFIGTYEGKKAFVHAEKVRRVMKKVVETNMKKLKNPITVEQVTKSNVQELKKGQQLFIYYGESTIYDCTVKKVDDHNVTVGFSDELIEVCEWDEGEVEKVNVRKSNIVLFKVNKSDDTDTEDTPPKKKKASKSKSNSKKDSKKIDDEIEELLDDEDDEELDIDIDENDDDEELDEESWKQASKQAKKVRKSKKK